MIYEATCTKCWEKFNPTPSLDSAFLASRRLAPPDTVWQLGKGFTPDDLVHGYSMTKNAECGGDGQLEGAWTTG